MDRLIATNSVPFANADTAPATGTAQYATSGNPVTNTPATIFPAYAWNMLQDEIYNVIIAAGLTPNRNAWNQLLTAIETMLQGSTTNVGVDTGAANAYVVAFTPALTAPIPWVPFWIKVAHANTGASTLNATGTVEPLVGGAHLALQGGEMVANGNALVYWNPTLAAGAGSYVLLFCSGASEQIAPATASQHAVQFGQVAGVVGSVRNLVMSVTAASATATLTADEIIVETALGGLRYCLPSFSKTINLATTGAGGMDTGTAPVSGYVALYAIWNPATQTAALLATNATSAAQPSIYGGANMPSGYTASALVSVWPTNASSQFAVASQQDREVFYFVGAVYSGAGTGTYTSLSLANAIPKNAKKWKPNWSVTASATAGVSTGIAPTSAGNGSPGYVASQLYAASGGISGSSFPDSPIVTAQTAYFAQSGTGSFVINSYGYTF